MNCDSVKLDQMIKLINTKPNGPSLVLSLIAYKIQSPNEQEALNSLSFLGNKTKPSVKERCIQLLYRWQNEHSQQAPKIRQAYESLRAQGEICGDPELPKSTIAFKQESSVFDRSAKSKRLAQLMKSKDPEDVREANYLIQSILRDDQKRVEKVNERRMAKEALANNAQLLDSMIKNAISEPQSNEADLELMAELADNIRKARPTLYRSSIDENENDEEDMTEIAFMCDHASTILANYEAELTALIKQKGRIVKGSSSTTAKPEPVIDLIQLTSDSPTTSDPFDIGMLDPFTPPASSTHSTSDVLKPSSSHSNGEMSSMSSRLTNRLDDLFVSGILDASKPSNSVSIPTSSSILPTTNFVCAAQPHLHPLPIHQPTSPILTNFSCVEQQPYPTHTAASSNSFKPTTLAPPPHRDAFDDLLELSREMMASGSTKFQSPQSNSTTTTSSSTTNGGSMNNNTEMHLISQPANLNGTSQLVDQIVDQSTDEILDQSKTSLPDLATFNQLTLSDINPSDRQPIPIFPSSSSTPSNSIRIALHQTGNRLHPLVGVYVVVATNSTNSLIDKIELRMAVEKPMRLLQLPSASPDRLEPSSPFLPPQSNHQIVLIADPDRKPSFKLKFILSFNLDGDCCLESGSVNVDTNW